MYFPCISQTFNYERELSDKVLPKAISFPSFFTWRRCQCLVKLAHPEEQLLLLFVAGDKCN